MLVVHVSSDPDATDSSSASGIAPLIDTLDEDGRCQSILLNPRNVPGLPFDAGTPGAVHAHDPGAIPAAIRVAAATGAALILSVSRPFDRFPKDALRRADRMIVRTREDRRDLAAYLGISAEERIVTLTPGCDLSAFDEDALFDGRITAPVERFLTRAEMPPLVAIGSPVRSSNLHGLVRAFGTDRSLQSRANLVLLVDRAEGHKDSAGEANAVLSELFMLIDRFDLWGKVAMPRAFPAADRPTLLRYAAALGGVFVAPSLNDRYGLPLVEAAAAGLPAIASRHGAAGEVAERCGHAVCVDPFNPAALSSAASDLLDDAERWQALAENGRRGLSGFTWDACAARYLDLVIEPLSRNAGSAAPAPQPIEDREIALSSVRRTSSRL